MCVWGVSMCVCVSECVWGEVNMAMGVCVCVCVCVHVHLCVGCRCACACIYSIVYKHTFVFMHLCFLRTVAEVRNVTKHLLTHRLPLHACCPSSLI